MLYVTNRWSWLHYVESDDKVFCHTCVKAHKEKKLSASCVEPSFISTGYTNWKDATVNFAKHEKSKCHADALFTTVTAPRMGDIGESLSAQLAKDKLERRQCFMAIIQNLRFLARQGLPLRGDGDETDSNSIQLLKLRANDDPRILEWVKKKTDKYTSGDMQNEILKVMAMKVLRNVVHSIHASKFFAILVDETTDSSNREQVVICLRWVDDAFEAHEEFIGVYQVDSITANTLVKVIKDVLLRMNLPLKKVRGQCYDGAAAMAGCRSGVAKIILDEEPRALFTHCYGHALNLACSDTIKKCMCLNDALSTTHEITKLIKNSPQRDACFQRLKASIAPTTPGIRILCPTRWTVKADTLQSILDNYTVLLETWQESLTVVKDTDMRARILGVSAQMNTFAFLFGAMLGQLLLRHSDNLSRTLQHTHISAAEGQRVATMTVKTLEMMRDDASFERFWTKTTSFAEELGIEEPQLPRRRKVPRRLESGNAEPEFPTSVASHYRRMYFEGLDLIVSCIKDRFDQPGYRIYTELECLILKAAQSEIYDEELAFVCQHYTTDFNLDSLKVQLETFKYDFCALSGKSAAVTLKDVITYARSLSAAQILLLSEVGTLLKLILVMPATNAVSERSFSALRRVKTFLRTTMNQDRLNHLMVLHVHKQLTDELNLKDVANDFVSASEHRLSLFGKFT